MRHACPSHMPRERVILSDGSGRVGRHRYFLRMGLFHRTDVFGEDRSWRACCGSYDSPPGTIALQFTRTVSCRTRSLSCWRDLSTRRLFAASSAIGSSGPPWTTGRRPAWNSGSGGMSTRRCPPASAHTRWRDTSSKPLFAADSLPPRASIDTPDLMSAPPAKPCSERRTEHRPFNPTTDRASRHPQSTSGMADAVPPPRMVQPARRMLRFG